MNIEEAVEQGRLARGKSGQSVMVDFPDQTATCLSVSLETK
jgi:hypothetical protein